MATVEILNSEAHGDLRVTAAADAALHFAQIVADEFLLAAHDFPILFTKHPDTGAFYAGVVMGLEPGVNLLAAGGRLPGYRPAELVRQGFFVSGEHLAVDRDHPAFADPAGDPVFAADGSPASALLRVQRALRTLHAGLPATEALIARLLQHRLLEPIDVQLDFDDGQRLRLDGLYTISLDALHALPDAAALALFRGGDLQLAYAQTGSVGHLRRLARIRNDRLLDPAA